MNNSIVQAGDYDAARVKASLLAKGLSMSYRAIENYKLPYLEKRRAYGNPDPADMLQVRIPQELYIVPYKIVCAVNIRNHSEWLLDFENNVFFLRNGEKRIYVTFPRRPGFYDQHINEKTRVSNLITLYGGSSLGVFVYRNCSLIQIRQPCQFCSLEPNLEISKDFARVVKEEDFRKAIRIALSDNTVPINQIMLNGGNFSDYDVNFNYYASIAKIARKVLDELESKVELHLIVFPPKTFKLFKKLEKLRISIAINTEVYDKQLFKKYCPGKASTYGQEKLLKALEEATQYLGAGSVYSIFVGGLESINSLQKGIENHAEKGIVPVINVLHIDPDTPLSDFTGPSEDEICQMGHILQQAYNKYGYRPFYENCGRNAIDYEAYLGLFSPTE